MNKRSSKKINHLQEVAIPMEVRELTLKEEKMLHEHITDYKKRHGKKTFVLRPGK
ncbi:MAG TPA: hypothetical protein VE978_12940 [Chitinophagales bacterium]|nr:hypothetical protein [Chitinophagales bacterium]